MYQDHIDILEVQKTGKEVATHACSKFSDRMQAIEFYKTARQRLLEINHWHQIAGFISATFRLTNNRGVDIDNLPEKGNYLKIDVPGPGSFVGDGYDWVRIEAIKEAESEHLQTIGIRVRPAPNPMSDSERIAHFYDDTATSNFIVSRAYDEVCAFVIDRNVKPNDDAASITDKIRDTTMGIGALSLFSKIQWNNLVKGLVKKAG